VIALVIALVLLAGGGVTAWLRYDRVHRTVELLAADTLGSGAFVPSAAPRLVPQVLFDAAAGPSPQGGLDGLYLDAFGTSGCDRRAMALALQSDPERAAAWESALSIRDTGSAAYLARLTAVRLRADTRFTAYRWSEREAQRYAAVLQSGTAVLIDDHGVPQVRCVDGSPLTAPEPVDRPRYDGGWTGFDPQRVIDIVRATAAVAEFGLVDPAGREAFRRPAGTLGEADIRALPATGRLVGGYVLTGPQTSCSGLADCSPQPFTLAPRFGGCPQRCAVSSLNIGEGVLLIRNADGWSADGNTPRPVFPCVGGTPGPGTFSVTFTPTASGAISGVWTATSVRAEFRVAAGATEQCSAASVSWTVSGTRS